MNHKTSNGATYITLSLRNVKQLLEAHEKGFTFGICRLTEDGTSLYVRVESDADHYVGREAGPGLDRILKDDVK